MARKFAKSFYNSKAWKDCQSAYKTFRFGICERCGRAEGTEVHHKIMLNESNINDPNVSLNFKVNIINDLLTVFAGALLGTIAGQFIIHTIYGFMDALLR